MIVSPTPENVDRAAGMLRDGELVSFPTETVYGLGADARNPDAVRRVFAAKRRPAEHPVIVHIADASGLPRWARSIPAGAKALAAAFWPGPLTLILPRASDVNDTVTGGGDSVGLRVPGHPVAQALLQRFFALGGDGVAAPSANRFGRISATTAQHVAEDFGEEIALILDGGACSHGIESTIVAFTDHEPAVLRPGAVPVENIAAVLGSAPRLPGAGAARAPGTHASHYAPHTPARWPRRAHRGTRAFGRAATHVRRRVVRRACAQRRVRAGALCQPARARRARRGRDLDRDAARRPGMERGARSSATGHPSGLA